tara:strand:+ start:441 stop:794 length:354 start_codon:yes stop_codon:yes gene_type:complete
MVIRKITPEAIKIALISKPQTKYELSQTLTASYNRTLKALKKYRIATDLPNGDLPFLDDLSKRRREQVPTILEGHSQKKISRIHNINRCTLNTFLSSHTELKEQWEFARLEREMNYT